CRAGTLKPLLRSISSVSVGAKSKKPKGVLPGVSTEASRGGKSDSRTRRGQGRSSKFECLDRGSVPIRRTGTLCHLASIGPTCTHAYRENERNDVPAGVV